MLQYLTVCGLRKMYQSVVCVRCRTRVVFCDVQMCQLLCVICIFLSKMHTFFVCVRYISNYLFKMYVCVVRARWSVLCLCKIYCLLCTFDSYLCFLCFFVVFLCIWRMKRWQLRFLAAILTDQFHFSIVLDTFLGFYLIPSMS